MWTPDAHPRWPKGTPHTGHIGAGEFMRIGDLLAKLSTQPSGTEDLTFLAKGASRIRSVIARRDSDPTRMNFDVRLNDGASHEVGAGISTDFSEVMGALQHIDQGGAIGVQPGQNVLHRGAMGTVANVDEATGIAEVHDAKGTPRFVPRDQLTHAPNLRPPKGGAPKQPPGGGGAPAAPSTASRAASKPAVSAHIQGIAGGALATVHHDDGSVSKTSHPSPAAAVAHVKAAHGLADDRIARHVDTSEQVRRGNEGTAPMRPTKLRVTPGRKESPAEKSYREASREAVLHGGKALPPVNTKDLKFGAGDTRAGQPRPHYGSVEQHISRADADKSITQFPAPPGPKASQIIPKAVLEHPDLHTTGATVLMHSAPGENGGRVYTDERKQLHDKIVADHLEGAVAQKNPVALFYAGGSASGKSTATKHLGEKFSEPEAAVHIDPDHIKSLLPEWDKLVEAGDPSGSSMTHEESSDLAKRIQAEAMAKGYNIVVDGTGDSGGTKFLDKLRTAATGKLWRDGKDTGKQAAGTPYEVHVFMVDAPSDVAVGRAYLRGEKTGRHLPPQMVRTMHAAVAKSMGTWQNDPHVTSWQAWSTYNPDKPDSREALAIAHGGKGQTVIDSQALYDEMLSKATGKSLHSESQQAINQSLAQPKKRVRVKANA